MKSARHPPQLDFTRDHRQSATMNWAFAFVSCVAVAAPSAAAGGTDHDEARRAFYNAQYKTAAALTQEPCATAPDGLSACELRTAALLFQIKRAIGDATDRQAAWKQCAVCPELAAEFDAALKRGQALARTTLKAHPKDDETLFLLGKLDLNFVWLYLGTLGRRTGWGEYWEARKSLDSVLARDPTHVRARVARGWIDYIVDTKMPRGTRWLLGGGSKKNGLAAVRQAAATDADFFARAEARFALWDMQVRERDLPAAVATARILARDFDENQELKEFIKTHDSPQ
jgi:hypothetical protein